jgi:hypothetical protein
MTAGILEQMFADALSPAEQAMRLEAFKGAMAESLAMTDSGRLHWDRHSKTLIKAIADPNRMAAALESLTKSLTGDQAAAMAADLELLKSNITKDWTPTSPVNAISGATVQGLVPYDLEAPAKQLVPHDTPLRNSIPRPKGQGNARQFKRILSYTNAGIAGGAASALPFFSSTSTTSTWGGLSLNRPPKITYTGDAHSVGYVELGFSDAVDWVSFFAGLGFDDLRALSRTALLWAHLLGEERAMLYGRGSGTGYEGAIAAPGAITAVASGSGATIANATYYVYVTALSGPSTGGGSLESVPSTVVNTGATTSASAITITVGTEPSGSLGYAYYVGTTTGPTNAHFQGTFIGNSVTITTTPGTSGANPSTSDTSANPNGYDGFLSILTDPAQSGYFKRINGTLSTANPGVEFDTMFTTMFTANGADPEELWLTAAIRTELNQLMRIGGTNGAASGYRTNVVTGDAGVTMSTTVTGYVNPATSRVVDIRVHRYMPAGCAMVRSVSLPIPDAQIPAPVAAVNVQEYMAIDWPDIQMTYDSSTYQYGTLVHYAPAWMGALVGVE